MTRTTDGVRDIVAATEGRPAEDRAAAAYAYWRENAPEVTPRDATMTTSRWNDAVNDHDMTPDDATSTMPSDVAEIFLELLHSGATRDRP